MIWTGLFILASRVLLRRLTEPSNLVERDIGFLDYGRPLADFILSHLGELLGCVWSRGEFKATTFVGFLELFCRQGLVDFFIQHIDDFFRCTFRGINSEPCRYIKARNT